VRLTAQVRLGYASQDSALVELRILGSVRLQASDGRDVEPLVRQPKRTALLAFLAAAHPRGPQRRDTLLAMFWPESDSARARAALSQALYVLRAALGEGAIVPPGDGAVGLSERAVWCDAVAFEAALDAGCPGDALALYRGDLLEGFFVTGAPEFERWLERERARLRERASEGAWALAEERATAGDTLEAERWARRAAELLPADEAVARRLIAFLHRLGDRAAAIRAYEAFASRLAQEYELEPSAETRALAETIRKPESQRPAALAAQPPSAAAPGASAGPLPPGLARSAPVWSRSRAAVLALLLTGLLAGGSLVFRAQLGARSTEAARTPKRLVVLPFANLGPAEEEYFADGITEEIAARLAVIDPLRVIGRTSATRYKRTTKTIQEIGRELGVSYILEGAVRWEKSPHGQARVRVTPQLVSTADGTHLWAQLYDEPLDEIFRVQSDIAQKVVEALHVALLEPQRRTVEAVPTRNLQAYDYYLHGNDFSRRGQEERFQRAAARMYEKATEFDSGFALAYAMLSRVHSRMYLLYYDHSQDRLTKAKWAVDKAFTLAPDLPEAHQSLGTYYWIGHTDYGRALREYAITEASRPNDPNLFTARAVLRGRQGNYAAAVADFAKALELDPGSASINSNYGENRDLTRDFARAESLYDRAIALSPDWVRPYFCKAGLYLRRDGSTKKAWAVLDEAQTVGLGDAPDVVFARVQVAIFDRRYDEAIARLSSGAPEVFADQRDFITRAHLYAQVYGLMERGDLERAYSDSARRIVLARLRDQPDDSRLHSALGLAYAGLGRKQQAIQEGQRGVDLRPISKDTYQGYYREWDLARIYVMVGEYDAAVDRLAYLVSIPGYLTPAWLRIDPTWDSLRGHPRFQRLVAQRK
jgi:TolB-like protein/DNA-binding SARP family transcriptional activator/Flp pilus assembly protein TadD